jgi:hypothetical protein
VTIVGAERTTRGREIISVVLGADGRIGEQAKTQIDPTEEPHYVAGIGRRVFMVEGVTFGIAICHEAFRYPEIVRSLVLGGAQIVFVPHFVTTDDGSLPTLWCDASNPYNEKAILCRALENTVYVAAADVAGPDQGSATCIIAPDGTLVARLEYGRVGVVAADIDLDRATRLLALRWAPSATRESPAQGVYPAPGDSSSSVVVRTSYDASSTRSSSGRWRRPGSPTTISIPRPRARRSHGRTRSARRASYQQSPAGSRQRQAVLVRIAEQWSPVHWRAFGRCGGEPIDIGTCRGVAPARNDAIAHSPEPEARSNTRRPATDSGCSRRYRPIASPPAQANAQYGRAASGSRVSSCTACHSGSTSSARWRRISSSPGTGRRRVWRSTKARGDAAMAGPALRREGEGADDDLDRLTVGRGSPAEQPQVEADTLVAGRWNVGADVRLRGDDRA